MHKDRVPEIIEKLQKSFNEYHKLFLENYPLLPNKTDDYSSIRKLNTSGIKCQTYLTMLGETAKLRMNYLGFHQLFAFDNEVDWYSWKIWVIDNNVNHTSIFLYL